MIDRKRRLRFIQFFLFLFSVIIIYLVYYNKESQTDNESISKKKETKSRDDSDINKDVFFNIEYSGFDLQGNRYSLKSEEAYVDEIKSEIIYMKNVDAVFYFKDDTVLYIKANAGVYNNKTLDMKFKKNVRAEYLKSKLFAENAEYSNSKSYLSISEKVRINDIQGNLIADKLLFDITSQKLDITSYRNGKVKANVNLDEKRF